MKPVQTLLLAVLCGCCFSSHAADRVALVVGNSRYANLPSTQQLASPVADAQDVAGALRALGYTLVADGPVTDADKDAFITATESFAKLAKNATAAVFYFSGHGVQLGEDNYLLPSDAPRLSGVSVLKNRTVMLRDSVMVALEEAGAQFKVIILDCCRDNPFAAQLDAALADTTKTLRTKSVGEISGYGPGFYLAFATSPGFTANDGNGQRNSPFTAALIKAMPSSAGKDIDFFFRDVKALLGDGQVSWTNHSLRASFALATSATPAPPEPPPAALPQPPMPVVQAPPPAPAPVTPLVLNGDIFLGSVYSSFNNYTMELVTRQLQAKLGGLGFQPGPVDGRPGRATQQALAEYQRAQGIPITGVLDDATLRALQLDGMTEQRPPAPVVTPRRDESPPLPSKTTSKPTPRVPSENLDEKFRRAAENFEKRK